MKANQASSTASGGGCSRRTLLESALVLSLIAAAIICAAVSYTLLRDSETTVAVGTFNSIAASALEAARANALQKLNAATVIATMLASQFPDAADWPLIEMPGYDQIAASVAKLSGTRGQAYAVITPKDSLQEFEDHAKGMMSRAGCPETANSDFGFGVWKFDPNEDKQYEDGRLPGVEPNWPSDWPNMAVVMLNSDEKCPVAMYNAYSEEFRGIHWDSMVQCANEHPEDDPRECFTTTDIQSIVITPDPSALIFHPIYPVNNPGVFVGAAITVTTWSNVLTNIIPSYVDGIVCVIETDTTSVMYEIRGGKPYFIKDETGLDPKYNKYKSDTIVLNDYTSYATSSVKYRLTVYPTAVVFQEFQTNTPWIVALVLVGVICVIAVIFLLFDIAVRKEAAEARAEAEAQADRYKQKFARRIAQGMMINETRRKSISTRNLEAEFKSIRKDKDGAVGREELREYVGDMMDDKDFEAMWVAIDLDGNGSIDFLEFCAYMAQIGSIADEEVKKIVQDDGGRNLQSYMSARLLSQKDDLEGP